MSNKTNIIETLTTAPLPELIEKLGLAIANAQTALDKNSIATAQAMIDSKIQLGNGKEYSLIALGFAPTFYAFTEATIEAKMEFSLAKTETIGVGIGIGGSNTEETEEKTQVISVNISASYARKFEQSAEGSSSIAARLISLPPPDIFYDLLKTIAADEAATE